MIIEMDDKEIEVDEEDLSSLMDMLNKHRVEQYHSLLSVLSDSQKQSDATPIMIAHFESALKKVSKDISAAIKSIPQPKDPLPHPKEMTVKMADNALPKALTSIEAMIDKMSTNVVSAVQSIPAPVIPPQSESKETQEPIKRIFVGDIERNNNGLIRSCVLEVER
jgi:hypothetical protein